MYSLFIDTSYKWLALCIMKDDEVIASYFEECFKKQSEKIFIELDNLFKKANVDRNLIDALYITIGPGSYTGVRISLTLAKVLCEIKKIKLYTISSLRLYANNGSKTMVIMDARSNRAYVGVYDKDKIIEDDKVISLDKIDIKDYDVVLDSKLLNIESKPINIIECFKNTKLYFNEIKDINHLAPKYFKESDSYYR